MNKSAAGAKKYYSEEYYSEGKSANMSYYSENEKVIGKWGGIAAERLGLKEDILKKDFSCICDNINPETGKRLTGRNDKDRTVGYDFTFNASKSVSLAYSFANGEDKNAILQAFRGAVAETMAEVETGMQARVRGKGQDENRETGNIVYGEFVHFTTRPINNVPDPHLHAHCFVFNSTYDGEEGKWKAGQFRQIKQDAPYYEACFHSNLAAGLERLGYKTERTKNGFEIKGIEKGTIEKFSRRTKEIEEHAREHNITDERQKAQIGARTREAKRNNTSSEHELKEWQSRLSGTELTQLRNLKSQQGDQNEITAKVAVEHSLSHHLERKSVASDKEILATAIKAATGQLMPEQVKEAFHANKEIISVKEKGRIFITTKEALSEEKQLIVNANSFKGRFSPINEHYQLKSGILNGQQQKAVQHALNTSDGIIIIAGKAGTGKTTLMKEVKQGINEAGKSIFPFAPSSEASRVVQRSEGFENADTLAALLQKKAMHPQLKGQVIWIDEAGQVSNKDMNRVLAIANEQNARVILSGDVRQHNSVERGDALRIIQQYAGIVPMTVSRIQRQRKADYKHAVKLLSEASIEKGFKKLESIGAIKEIADCNQRLKAVAEDYYNSAYKGEAKQGILVIAPTHAEGEAVTREIRNRLKENRVIGENGREFTILKSMQYTAAEKKKAGNYRPGHVLSFHQNVKGIKAGSKLEVLHTDRDRIAAVDAQGKSHFIPLSKSGDFNVFERRNIEVAKGDQIRITGNGKAADGKHLFNGITYQVTGFDRQGDIKLSNGSQLPKNYGHFTFGYVMTSHASQGKTADKIIIAQSSASFRAGSQEQFYVSVSRGRQAVSIYTDDKAALLQSVTQSAQRLSAIELLAKSLLNVAIENSRQSAFRKLKGKAIQVAEKFIPQIKKK